MEPLVLSVIRDMAEKLDNGYGVGHVGAELHNELCNQEQFCEDRDDAKKFLGDHAFDAIKLVKTWEETQMGESHTNFSCPCCVANMFAYCIGDYALGFSYRLNGYTDSTGWVEGRWENELDQKDLNTIRDELTKIKADNLLEIHSDDYDDLRNQRVKGPHAQHAA